MRSMSAEGGCSGGSPVRGNFADGYLTATPHLALVAQPVETWIALELIHLRITSNASDTWIALRPPLQLSERLV
jgi:hypothetical protein